MDVVKSTIEAHGGKIIVRVNQESSIKRILAIDPAPIATEAFFHIKRGILNVIIPENEDYLQGNRM